MALVIRANYPNTYQFGPLFDEAIRIGYEGKDGTRPLLYPQYMRVVAPDAVRPLDRFRYTELIDGGAPTQVNEGAAVPTSPLVQGFEKEFPYVKFVKGLEITDEALQDEGRMAQMTESASKIGRSFQTWQELECAKIFANGFNAGIRTGPDGKALFATDHPFPTGITGPAGQAEQSNLGTGELNVPNLDAAVQAMFATLSAAGAPDPMVPSILMVPPVLGNVAKRLLGSPNLPGSGNNDINPMNSLGITPVVNPYLGSAAGGSDSAWFLIAGTDHRVTYWQRTAITTEIERIAERQTNRYTATHRAQFGFTDWRGVYGSTGTGG